MHIHPAETTQLDPRRKPDDTSSPPQCERSLRWSRSPSFDADLEEVYKVGEWSEDVRDVLKNICVY